MHLSDVSPSTFKFTQISEDFVLNELKNLQTNKSTGLDTISAQLLKTAAPVISKHLTYLFNFTLRSGKIPSDRKEAKVSPIYKGGDRTDKNNYRPVSVISVVMKILERAVTVTSLPARTQYAFSTAVWFS